MYYPVSLTPDQTGVGTDSKTIKFYTTVLDTKLKEIIFPLHLLSCTKISCDNPIADIENIYFLLLTRVLFRHQLRLNIKRKLRARETSLRVGIENLIMLEKLHYSGNGCGFNVINQFLVSCTV